MITFLYFLIPKTIAEPSAQEILDAVDANMAYDSRSARIKMTVSTGRRTKVYEMQSFGRGKHEAAIEFFAPARDKGTKMLKKDDELWMFLPSIEKTQKISGHMLRQGMMGSDMSYEDLLEATQLSDYYTATVIGTDVVSDRPCYQVEMIAKSTETTYSKRLSCIDTEYLVPVQEKLYAVSGMLLKEWTMTDVQDFNGRKFPTTIIVQDKLQEDSITTIQFVSLEFSIPLEDEVFHKRWLER
jgi:outer membrane lipoprotein-sorting protein